VGSYHIGVRSNHPKVDGLLRAVLAAHLVEDDDAPPNYSVFVNSDERDLLETQGLHFLYRTSTKIARSREVRPIFDHLLASLQGHLHRRQSDVLRVRAVGFVRGGRAVIAPAAVSRDWPAIEPRLRRAGVRLVDTSALQIDPTRRQLIVEPLELHIDDDALASVPGSAQGHSATINPPGRYDVVAWLLDDRSGTTTGSTAHAIAEVIRWLPDASTLGGRRMLTDLVRLLVPTSKVPTPSPGVATGRAIERLLVDPQARV
jgi:hypothetical protein